jgi:membrane protein DedA with SNARE-associated domain
LNGEPSTPVVPEREPRRGPLVLLIAPIVVMIACGYVADALWPTLVEEHPLWLLGLSARNRYALLVVNRVDLWAYYLWGTLRLLLPDPFFFALGWFYGPAALRWMEHRTPTVGTMMRRVENLFARWGHPLVVILPNNYVCLVAGAARMSPVLFAFLNVTGTIGRLALLQVLGSSLTRPIDWFLDLVAQYRIPLLVVSTVVVVIMASGELRRGRKDIEDLQDLERSGEPGAPPAPNHPYDPRDPDPPPPGHASGANASETTDEDGP